MFGMFDFKRDRAVTSQRRRIARTLLAAAATIGAVAVAPTAVAAGAAPSRCSKQVGKLPGAKGSAVFAQGTSLYVCFGPRDVSRIGPWTPGRSIIAADDDHESLVWTVRGAGGDRVWAWREGRPWLRGVAPSPGPLETIDREVKSLRVTWLVAAWVTGGGQVVQSVDRPKSEGRGASGYFYETYFGESEFSRFASPAVATSMLTPPADVLKLPQAVDAGKVPEKAGLRATIALTQPTGLLTQTTIASTEVVGRWPIAAGKRFAKSLKIDEVSSGADFCSDAYNDAWLLVSVVPTVGSAAIGWSTPFTRGSTDASIEGRTEECGG